MRALIKFKDGYDGLELRDMELPVPKANEVLVKVHSCGVCGTDLKIQEDGFPYTPPVIIGHEFSGTIEKVGDKVTDWKAGDRVIAEQHFHHCGKCEYCLTGRRQFCPSKRSPGYFSDGAFAEYIAVEQSLLHLIPENLSFEQAALVEPMGIAASAILGKAGVNPGEFVVILGTGPIALLALQMVKAAGAAHVVTTGLDVDEDSRFKAALAFGADMTINVQQQDPVEVIKGATGGKMADLVIDLSGAAPAILSGFNMLKKDGRFCAIGLPHGNVDFPWADAVLKAVTVFFSFSSDFRAWERCLQMMSDGKIKTDGFTDNCFALEDWSSAFDMARSGKALKVIIKPS